MLEVVKMLVEELGADVNFVADTGETALHAAAYRGVNTVVQYLFDKGAKLDVLDKSGRTPLQVADGVEYGNSFAANPTHCSAAAQAGGEGNTVSGSLSECDSGRSIAARGGCAMRRRLPSFVAATCFIVAAALNVPAKRSSPPASRRLRRPLRRGRPLRPCRPIRLFCRSTA